MKKFVMGLLLFLCSVSVALAEGNVFKYDPEKMDVGSVYDYSIKELNGKKEMKLHFFVKDANTVLCYIDFSTVIPQVFVVEAKFDPEYCCFKSTYGYNPFAYVRLVNSNDVSTMSYDFDKSVVNMTMSYFDGTRKLKKMTLRKTLSICPSYEESLYQLDLWFAMRFVGRSEKKFKIGSLSNGTAGVDSVEYKGTEMVMGTLCDKWEISQEGLIAMLTNKKRTIWFDRNDKFYKVVKYVNNTNVYPVGKLDLNFVGKSVMTNDEWASLVASKNEEARIRLNFPKGQ